MFKVEKKNSVVTTIFQYGDNGKTMGDNGDNGETMGRGNGLSLQNIYEGEGRRENGITSQLFTPGLTSKTKPFHAVMVI